MPERKLSGLLARLGFPEGTVTVGLGLVIAGVCAYGFLIISGRALGPARYAQLSVLWSATFLLGTGLFMPLEQEVARVVAIRRTRGLDSGRALRRAAMLGVATLAVLGVASLPLHGAISDRFFDSKDVLLPILAFGLLGLALGYVARGFLAANGSYLRYGSLNAVEGLFRVVPALVLAVAGVRTVVPYALAFAAAPLLAVIVSSAGPIRRSHLGPDCGPGELDLGLARLIVASVLGQALINLPVLSMKFLSQGNQSAQVGRLMAGVVLARVPVILFAAVQAALLPRLSAMAATSRWKEFRQAMFKLTVAIASVGIAATTVAATIGAPLIKLLFGKGFELRPSDLFFLAAAASAFLLSQALSQGLLALGSYRSLIAAWGAGVIGGLAITSLPGELLLRVERGFLGGAAISAVVMGLTLASRLRQPAGTLEIEAPSSVKL